MSIDLRRMQRVEPFFFFFYRGLTNPSFNNPTHIQVPIHLLGWYSKRTHFLAKYDQTRHKQ